MYPLHRKLAAEALGTFALVFVGTGAIVVDAASGGRLGPFAVALAFGGVVAAMIAAFGHVSGAHLNPAVSFGFWRAGQMPGRTALLYAVAQAMGAVAASLLLRVCFPTAPGYGATAPAPGVPLFGAFGFEVLITVLLMFVILGVSHGAKEEGVIAALAIGATVGLCAFFGGAVTGASMNPARSLGPALVSGQLGGLWLYLLAPLLGAWLAVPACRLTHPRDCCRAVGDGAA